MKVGFANLALNLDLDLAPRRIALRKWCGLVGT